MPYRKNDHRVSLVAPMLSDPQKTWPSSLVSSRREVSPGSGKVVEVPFKTLLAGKVQTTYGTDFDCIAEHALATRLDKAVILTDGYASMTEENQEQLKARAFRALTVLVGGRKDSPEFEALGDVVQLEDVTC